MTEAQSDIREFLSELQADRTVHSSHVERMNTIMRHFAAKAIPLSICADARHLNRSLSTLKRYARDLKFPDFVPMHLREQKK